MGQQVVQVLLGIDTRAANVPRLTSEDGDPLWDHAGLAKEERLLWQDLPDYGDDGRIVGFRVAAGPGCDDDEGFLGEPCALEDFATHYEGHLTAAQAKWTTFAIWMESRCSVRLPPPRLFLCDGERA